MARGATEQRRPVWLKLVVSGVVIVGGVALAAVFVPQFLFSQTAEVALIRGDDAPFKIKPAEKKKPMMKKVEQKKGGLGVNVAQLPVF